MTDEMMNLRRLLEKSSDAERPTTLFETGSYSLNVRVWHRAAYPRCPLSR